MNLRGIVPTVACKKCIYIYILNNAYDTWLLVWGSNDVMNLCGLVLLNIVLSYYVTRIHVECMRLRGYVVLWDHAFMW